MDQMEQASQMDRMEQPKDILMKSLGEFYAQEDNLRKLTDVLVRGGGVSLRTLDYLVTNYAKTHGVCYIQKSSDGGERLFSMHKDYKCMLRSFSKKMFDVFKRRSRVTYKDVDGTPFESTPAQLNFFRWAIKNGVLEYGIDHTIEIEKDMVRTATLSHATPGDSSAQPEKTRRHTAQGNGTRTTLVRVKVRFA